MYNKRKSQQKTSLTVNQCFKGETIEEKVRRIMHNGEPVTDGAPQIYTEFGEGVVPETNIRADRFELALEVTDALHKDKMTKREAFLKKLDEENKKKGQSEQPGSADTHIEK